MTNQLGRRGRIAPQHLPVLIGCVAGEDGTQAQFPETIAELGGLAIDRGGVDGDIPTTFIEGELLASATQGAPVRPGGARRPTFVLRTTLFTAVLVGQGVRPGIHETEKLVAIERQRRHVCAGADRTWPLLEGIQTTNHEDTTNRHDRGLTISIHGPHLHHPFVREDTSTTIANIAIKNPQCQTLTIIHIPIADKIFKPHDLFLGRMVRTAPSCQGRATILPPLDVRRRYNKEYAAGTTKNRIRLRPRSIVLALKKRKTAFTHRKKNGTADAMKTAPLTGKIFEASF